MWAIAAHNLAYESALGTDYVLTCARNRRLANEAWGQVQKADPDHAYSKDYALGFKDGFADYLDEGGCAEPPPLPARRYWMIHYRTPGGHAAINDWFAGFQHGVAAARESGYRELVIVPSSVPDPGIPHPPPEPGPEVSHPVIEPVLPSPRPLLPAPRLPEPLARPPAEDEGAG
jgi:hypothetical protein